MIDLRFELNDFTGKYDARSHHIEIYISDDTKMNEETVRLYKYILDELIQHSIGGLSHLIFYNGKNSDKKTKELVIPHITVSLSENGRAVDTGELEFKKLSKPVKITGKFGFYLKEKDKEEISFKPYMQTKSIR